MTERGIAGIGWRGFQALRTVKFLVLFSGNVSEDTNEQKFLFEDPCDFKLSILYIT